MRLLEMYVRPKDEEISMWEQLLEEFQNKFNISFECSNYALDITKICKLLGFNVVTLNFDDSSLERFDGFILVDKNEKVIGVNDEVSLQDARFIIAHELSHYITCKDDLEFAFKDKKIIGATKDSTENQMDYMAAAILVPRDSIKTLLTGFGIEKIRDLGTVKEKVPSGLIQILAKIFMVNEDLIVRRIIEVS